MKCVPFPTMYVDLTQEDFVSRWSASCRTKINKAGQEQLTVERGRFLLKDVLKLFLSTVKRKGLRGYSEADFDRFSDIEVSAISIDGVMQCGHVWVLDKEEKRALLYVSATNHTSISEESSLVGRAHYFLLWQDGLFFQQHRMTVMDLMGYQPDTSDPLLKGVYQWKAATHGTQEILYHYYPLWFYLLRKFRSMFAR